MNWSKNKSIVLSKICIFGMLILCIFLFLFAHRLFLLRNFYNDIFMLSMRRYFTISTYCLLPPAFTALYFLYRLLDNISRSEVFTERNIFYMRVLSWSCFLAALICLLSAFYYRPFFLLAFGAGFMGMILRVVKNVFAQALLLKEENDFTI